MRKPPSISYGVDDAPPLELPEKRPSNEEVMASAEGERKLAGFMLRRFADRVSAVHRPGDDSLPLRSLRAT